MCVSVCSIDYITSLKTFCINKTHVELLHCLKEIPVIEQVGRRCVCVCVYACMCVCECLCEQEKQADAQRVGWGMEGRSREASLTHAPLGVPGDRGAAGIKAEGAIVLMSRLAAGRLRQHDPPDCSRTPWCRR